MDLARARGLHLISYGTDDIEITLAAGAGLAVRPLADAADGEGSRPGWRLTIEIAADGLPSTTSERREQSRRAAEPHPVGATTP